MNSLRVFSAVAVVVGVGSSVFGQILSEQLNQLDIYNGIPTENTVWGKYRVEVTPGAELSFINVVASDQWIVRNLPVPLIEDAAGSLMLETAVDLGAFGWTEGMNLTGTSVTLQTSLGLEPWSAIRDIGSLVPVTIGNDFLNAVGRAVGDTVGGPGTVPELGTWDLSGWPDVDFQFRFNMPNVQQGPNECGPGSAANSLEWLRSEYTGDQVPLDDTLNERLDDLSGRMHTDHRKNGGVSDANFLDGKLAYLDDDVDVNLLVKFMGIGLGNADRKVGSTVADAQGTLPTLDFILDEINHGEDVEIAMTFYRPERFTDSNGNGKYDAGEPFTDENGNGTWDEEIANGGHWITAAGKLVIGGYAGIWFVEDSKQGEAFIDANGNGEWDPEESYDDVNGNGVHDEGEPFDDVDGDGAWDPSELAWDDNGNGFYDPYDDVGTGVWGFSPLEMRPDGFLTLSRYPSRNRIDFVVSESIPEPSVVGLSGSFLAFLTLLWRRRPLPPPCS